MSLLLKKHAPFLRILQTTTSRLQRKALLDTITNDQLKVLVEVTVNVLRGALPLTKSYKVKLQKHKKLIRALGDQSISLKTKKTLLCRQGQAIALLLKSVEPYSRRFCDEFGSKSGSRSIRDISALY
jgi:hypothetical protein